MPWAIRSWLRLLGCLAQHARKTDIVGRWGGEEFVMVLSGANEAGARVVGERIRRAAEAMAVLNEKESTRVRLPVSIGIACLEVDDTPGWTHRAGRPCHVRGQGGWPQPAWWWHPRCCERTVNKIEIPKSCLRKRPSAHGAV